MDFEREAREGAADGAEGVCGDDVNVQLFAEGSECGTDAGGEMSVERKRAGEIADEDSEMAEAEAGDVHSDAGFFHGHGARAGNIVAQKRAAGGVHCGSQKC